MSTRRVDQMTIRRESRSVIASCGSPFGDWEVVVAEGALVGVSLPRGERTTRFEAERRRQEPTDCGHSEVGTQDVSPEDRAALAHWTDELKAYFRGDKLSWTTDEVDLGSLGLGDFERAVYETLLTVPAGATVGYGELAEMAGFPRAARAVGTAMANNPIPLVVPCHRVIRADGSLGNYGNDPSLKPKLLDHETACIRCGGSPR
jgi:methylated-DNA-[protein]-cysteine S-methyltransferase